MIRNALKKATLALLIPIAYFFHLIGLLSLDDRTEDTDENDRITSFEASEPDIIEYRPIEYTLEDAADSPTEYNVYTERRVAIDPDRLEEWVDANYDDETHVHIRTKHGSTVLSRGEPVEYECPVCSRNTSLIKTTGGEREWIHIDEDRSCTLEVSNGE